MSTKSSNDDFPPPKDQLNQPKLEESPEPRSEFPKNQFLRKCKFAGTSGGHCHSLLQHQQQQQQPQLRRHQHNNNHQQTNHTATAMSHNDIVTQVTQDSGNGVGIGAGLMHTQDEMMDEDYNTEIKMNMRGHMFTITRDDLMALPESILLCLFPNGIFVGMSGEVITNLTEDDIVSVNFEPECFQYICQIFDVAVRDLHYITEMQNVNQQFYDINDPNILNDRPSIIVLREDLDYYCIPPIKNLTVEQMRHIKLLVGQKLIENKKIFDGLGYVSGKQLRPAEQHLMDMLCNSGFSLDENWGHRSLEPGKTVVFSLTLARLNNGTRNIHDVNNNSNSNSNTNTNTNSPNESPKLGPSISTADSIADDDREREKERGRHKEKRKSRLSTLAHSISRAGSRARSKSRNPNNTKLLLFWRKPARKCWWSDSTITVDLGDIGLVDNDGNPMTSTPIKIHVRRVWTLELSIIGIQ